MKMSSDPPPGPPRKARPTADEVAWIAAIASLIAAIATLVAALTGVFR